MIKFKIFPIFVVSHNLFKIKGAHTTFYKGIASVVGVCAPKYPVTG